jgi:hypothetical protein
MEYMLFIANDQEPDTGTETPGMIEAWVASSPASSA